MRTFNKHLKDKLNNSRFKELYNEEKKLAKITIRIQEQREKKGLSQKEVAEKAHITQQQLSKVENGENCNIITFLKVCNALELDLDFKNNIKSPVYIYH